MLSEERNWWGERSLSRAVVEEKDAFGDSSRCRDLDESSGFEGDIGSFWERKVEEKVNCDDRFCRAASVSGFSRLDGTGVGAAVRVVVANDCRLFLIAIRDCNCQHDLRRRCRSLRSYL